MTLTAAKKMKIYSIVLNYIKKRGYTNHDSFAEKLTDLIIQALAKSRFDLQTVIARIETNFFMLNSIKRSDFYSVDLEKDLKKAWYYKEIEVSPATTTSVVEHKIKIVPKGEVKRLTIEEIQSFEKVKDISPERVLKLVPLIIEEKTIKESLAQIIGEKFVQEDWGGERSDFFTPRLILYGKRVNAAFLLKGKGTKGKLTIGRCGKRGNQVMSLVKEPARLFVIQHIDEIDSEVEELLRTLVVQKSENENVKLYYCLMDGVDSARLLLAYDKIKNQPEEAVA